MWKIDGKGDEWTFVHYQPGRQDGSFKRPRRDEEGLI